LASDLVVFDAASVLDRAIHEEPEQAPAGVLHVLVNGAFAFRGGRERLTVCSSKAHSV
jgi:hypothetical protein